MFGPRFSSRESAASGRRPIPTGGAGSAVGSPKATAVLHDSTLVPSDRDRPAGPRSGWRSTAAWCLVVLITPFASGLTLRAETPTPPAAATESEAVAPEPAPRLEVDALEVQLGEIVRGQKVEAHFELRNTGQGTLRIERAKPG